MFRSRYLVALMILAAVAVGTSLWSCAHTPDVRVRDVNLPALRDSIIARVPSDSLFDPDPQYGEEDSFDGFLGFGKTRGLIQPHRTAHAGSLAHMKFLARIRVNKDWHGLAPTPDGGSPVWNYWVVAQLTIADERKPRWVSVYVAPQQSGHIVVRELSAALSPAPHTRGMAKWRHSRTAPWASCSDNMCCCEDSGCRTPVAAHLVLMDN